MAKATALPASMHLMLLALLAGSLITVATGQKQQQGPRDAQCQSPTSFAGGYGLALQGTMLMASLLLAGLSVCMLVSAIMAKNKTAELLSELRSSIAVLQDAATAPAASDRLSSILMKLDLAAEATSAAAETITDAMIADSSRSADQIKTGGKNKEDHQTTKKHEEVHAGTKRHWAAAKGDKLSSPAPAAAAASGGGGGGDDVGDLISLDAGSGNDDTIKVYDQDREVKRHHDDQAGGGGGSNSVPGDLASPASTHTPPLAAAAAAPDTPIYPPVAAKDLDLHQPGITAAAAAAAAAGKFDPAAAPPSPTTEHKSALAAIHDEVKDAEAKVTDKSSSLVAAAPITRTPYNTPAVPPPQPRSELAPDM